MNIRKFKIPSFKHSSESIYSKKILFIYDLLVLGLSNKFAWKCPTGLQLDFYNQHVSSNHLDVGVGTGFFLDKCDFPTENPTVHLLDLNSNSLEAASRRIRRYQPEKHQANILAPLTIKAPTFDSIGMNYLLHCLPGDLDQKEIVFKNLKPFLNKDGTLFGATILGKDVKPNFLAKSIMRLYNTKGIFSNSSDNLLSLEKVLANNFKNYSIKKIGCVALFSATV